MNTPSPDRLKQYWKIHGKWRVIEDNPRPDDYIVIMAPGWDGETLIPYSEHSSEISAAVRARVLMGKFEAKKIKIYYPDGRSKTLR